MSHVKVIIEESELRIPTKEWEEFVEWRINNASVRLHVKQIFENNGKDVNNLKPRDMSYAFFKSMKEVFENYGYLGFYKIGQMLGKSYYWAYNKYKAIQRLGI